LFGWGCGVFWADMAPSPSSEDNPRPNREGVANFGADDLGFAGDFFVILPVSPALTILLQARHKPAHQHILNHTSKQVSQMKELQKCGHSGG
jgi:hypothetical protein